MNEVCAFCTRKLRSEKSKVMGYGPVCGRRAYGTPREQRARLAAIEIERQGNPPIFGDRLEGTR